MPSKIESGKIKGSISHLPCETFEHLGFRGKNTKKQMHVIMYFNINKCVKYIFFLYN